MLSEDGKLDKQNLTAFIKENSLELVIPFSQEVIHTWSHTRLDDFNQKPEAK